MFSSGTGTPQPPADAAPVGAGVVQACAESMTVTLITPAGDPVNAPVSTQVDGQNEFTFDTNNPGVLTMKLKARVDPAGCAPSMQPRVRFRVDPIGASVMAWDAANPEGRPIVNGDFLEATVTFTGLPARNADFGRKTAKLLLDGREHQTARYEVFFPRDEMNHPDPDNGVTPNWFFYWSQVAGFARVQYAGGPTSDGTMAAVLGMAYWDYDNPPDKTTLYVYVNVVTRTSAYGVGKTLSGIDNFVASLHHESKHVDQIARADALVPHDHCWRYGYSWNQTPHNHWRPGRDGRWGPRRVPRSSLPVRPPFTHGPGGGDDVSIQSAIYDDWPADWPLPLPLRNGIHPIEEEAIKHADGLVSEHDYADQDWGDPGKNHQTLLRYDD